MTSFHKYDYRVTPQIRSEVCRSFGNMIKEDGISMAEVLRQIYFLFVLLVGDPFLLNWSSLVGRKLFESPLLSGWAASRCWRYGGILQRLNNLLFLFFQYKKSIFSQISLSSCSLCVFLGGFRNNKLDSNVFHYSGLASGTAGDSKTMVF